IHFIVLGGVMTLLGYQIIHLGIMGKAISAEKNILVDDKFIRFMNKNFTLEKGISIGLLIFFIGFLINVYILASWIGSGFGELRMVRPAILGLILIVMGIQTFFSAFLMSMIGMSKAD
ncbi:MAG TPA: hypothetical protein P5128_09670, partial [Candidatus Sumerlaeia bacterium]|nr:hypothetical protein [Candidatus Sumerlaeia bacterium]